MKANHNNIVRCLFFMACLLTVLTVQSAVTFTAHAPRQVEKDSKFKVSFVLSDAEGSSFTPPDIAGAQKIYGPALSTSYSSSWVNGKTSQSSSQEYTMIYKATSVGRLNVGAATIEVGGKRLSTRPITIDVIPAGKASQSQQQSSPSQQPQPRGGVQYNDPLTQGTEKNVTGNDIFVRIEMSKPRVYEQQAVVCTIKLYTKYQVSQFIPTLQPSFDGFLIEEIPMQPSLNNVETHHGQQYMVAVLKKCILYPQQSGKLTITSGNYDVNVVQYENFRTIFGTLSQPVEKKLVVKSNSATVNILPLPEPRPAGFNGAVGKFNVTTELKPVSLKTYAAATYSYRIAGTGNLKYIKAPEVTFPKEMDVYDPKIDVKINAGSDMNGTATVNYTFIPQFAGKFVIPASHFVYFNPDTERYDSIAVPATTLQVAKGEGAPSNHYRLKNMDIRHIHNANGSLSKNPSFMLRHWGYWLAYLIPTLTFAATLVYYRKQLRLRADASRLRNRRAGKLANRRLRKAQRLMASNAAPAKFYGELLSSVWGYMSDKFNIPVSELNRDNLMETLNQHEVDDELKQQILDLIDQCEFAQYAPQLSGDDRRAVFERAASAINSLEKLKPAKPSQS